MYWFAPPRESYELHKALILDSYLTSSERRCNSACLMVQSSRRSASCVAGLLFLLKKLALERPLEMAVDQLCW